LEKEKNGYFYQAIVTGLRYVAEKCKLFQNLIFQANFIKA